MLTTIALVALAVCAAPQPELRTEPVLRGTLWWVVDRPGAVWDRDRLRTAIEAQREVGFDLLWVFNTPALLEQATTSEEAGTPKDTMAIVYDLADEMGMGVIVDLPKGGWYQKNTAEEMIAAMTGFAERYHARYGKHDSFYGWYLNHEINPIAPDGAAESAFWRRVWKAAAKACHEKAPGSVVTISPFFLLDEPSRRGFVYLSPKQYADWWGTTLAETGIDILMLQDSGEHLSFFTLEQREPFFAAVAEACHRAGAQFWVNVETGEAHVANWDEYIKLYWEKKVPWRFTPMPWLEQKLRLAAKHGDVLINWGYYPYMNPCPLTGQAQEGQQEAYEAYKAYYRRITAGAGRDKWLLSPFSEHAPKQKRD